MKIPRRLFRDPTPAGLTGVSSPKMDGTLPRGEIMYIEVKCRNYLLFTNCGQ